MRLIPKKMEANKDINVWNNVVYVDELGAQVLLMWRANTFPALLVRRDCRGAEQIKRNTIAKIGKICCSLIQRASILLFVF